VAEGERARKKRLRQKLEAERRLWLQQLEAMKRWLDKHQSGKNSSPL
jgi:hypothetical protein